MSLSDLTLLIPFYRTARLLPHVFGNIDDHVARGGRVICSDEHGLDDAATRVAARYAGNDLVRVIASDAGGDWVSNCNRLILACETPFYRIAPHDDTVPAESSALLVEVLRRRPEAVLSHGWVRAETEAGRRLPERDEPRFPLRPVDDDLVFAAGLFWQGLYSGAFKAVMRRDIFRGGPLLIRPTPDLKHSERAWLFAHALVGDFAFTDAACMIKRYWTGSLTDSWRPSAESQIAVARVMAGFVDDLVADPDTREALRHNLYLNAVRRAGWLDGMLPARPPFEPPFLPGVDGAKTAAPLAAPGAHD